MSKFLSGRVFISLGYILRMELLGHRVVLFLTFGETAELFSTGYFFQKFFSDCTFPRPCPVCLCGPFSGLHLVGITMGEIFITVTGTTKENDLFGEKEE